MKPVNSKDEGDDMKNGKSGTSEQSKGSATRFVVIGAGMAGILSAIKLKEAGYSDFTVYEKADRLGGTWRENTYPGIACDVPSHFYRYTFAPNPEWTQVFSPGAEILDYFEEVARNFDVEKHIRYSTEIGRMEFQNGRWQIETTNGEHDEADFVIAATGVLHHPSFPDIKGLDDFEGAMFHSSRWDHTVPLAGQRVGVIGTGSTAIQISSALVDTVGEYHLFQRTAQWVMPAANPPIEEEDKERYRKDPALMQETRDQLAQQFAGNFASALVDAESPQLKMLEQFCKANLEDNVTDPVLREKLRPNYRAACKRLIMSPDFYQKIQRPNAHVVTESIDCIEANGVRTEDGELHELDVLVLATGFHPDRFMRPIEVVGRNGVALDDVWRERPSAYLAISIPEFPNLFMLNGPNGPVGNYSLIDVAELQFAYIMQLVELVATGQCQEVSATRAAADRFEEDRVEAVKGTVWMTGCRSWYMDDRGIPALWPWKFDRFLEEMAQPKLSDYELVGSEST